MKHVSIEQAAGEIDRMIVRVRNLPARMLQSVTEAAMPAIAREIDREFAGGRDPYGKQWAALQPATLRKHGPPPLTDSGAMHRGAQVTTPGRGQLRIRIDSPAQHHQWGFRNARRRVPARRLVPQIHLPASWRTAIEEAVRRVLKGRP